MLVKIGPVLSKQTASSGDKQDVDKVLAFLLEKARRKLFQSKMFLTTAVYTFILKIPPLLCGTSERTCLGLVVMDNCSSNVKFSSNHTFMKSLGTELSDDDKRLPYLYWTPKSCMKHSSETSLYSWFLKMFHKKQLSSLLKKILSYKDWTRKYIGIKTSHTGVNNIDL